MASTLLLVQRDGSGELKVGVSTGSLLGELPGAGGLPEEGIELLKGLSSGLGVEEVDDGNESGVEAHEDKEELPSQVLSSEGSDFDDNEVPEPVGGGGKSSSLVTETKLVDFGGVQPGGSNPGESGVGSDVKNDEDNSSGSGLDVSSLGGKLDTDSDDSHANSLSSSTEHQRLATSPIVDENNRDEGEDEESQSGTSSNDQGKLTFQVQNLLQQVGRVENNSVDTSKLLHHLDNVSQSQTTESLLLSSSEVVSPGDLSGSGLAELQSGGDVTVLSLNDRGLSILSLQQSESLKSLLVASLSHQESRGLRKTEQHDSGDSTEDNLENDRGSPLDGRVLREGSSVGQPVRDSDTNGNEPSLNGDHTTTGTGLGGLGLVHGDSGGVDSVTDSSDDTSDDHVSNTEGGSLENGTDKHDEESDPDRRFATKTVAHVEG
jgi:hypothetical protein